MSPMFLSPSFPRLFGFPCFSSLQGIPCFFTFFPSFPKDFRGWGSHVGVLGATLLFSPQYGRGEEGHTHTHPHTHTHTHTPTCTRTRTRIRARARSRAHARAHAHAHAHTEETHTQRGMCTRMLHLPFSDLPLKKCPKSAIFHSELRVLLPPAVLRLKAPTIRLRAPNSVSFPPGKGVSFLLRRSLFFSLFFTLVA